MARDKAECAHVEHPEHEAPLAGALALANLFRNCVEAFGLIHPSQKWDRPEQLLLVRLGIQQARLLIWGDIVGITSPPKTVTDRAVPKHPSAAYPDLKEPTFFGPRDPRLDDSEVRTDVEHALSAIVDRGSVLSREEMMEQYGLKPPKRFSAEHPAPLDTNRLEHFRERYELLQEVGEDYAHLNTRRNNSITHTSWVIADYGRFDSFIKLTQEQIDFLINSFGLKEAVDLGLRMDIKGFGWHLTQDRFRVALDVSKLQLVQDACKEEYPEYLGAIKEALDHIEREKRENAPPPPAPPVQKANLPKSNQAKESHSKDRSPTKDHQAKPNDTTNGKPEKHKRPGLLKLFKSFGKSRENVNGGKGRTNSVSEETPRSKSESAPSTQPPTTEESGDGSSLEPVRSKSVGDIMDGPGMDDEFLKNRLQQMATINDVAQPEDDLENMISRHDQYHGIARIETRDQRQGW